MKEGDTVRIGDTTITLGRLDRYVAMMLVYREPSFSIDAVEPGRMPSGEKLVIPRILWDAFEKLLELRGDIDEIVKLCTAPSDSALPGVLESDYFAVCGRIQTITRIAVKAQRNMKR